MPPAVIIAGAAVAGAVAGSMKDKKESSSGINLAPANSTEDYGQGLMNKSAHELEGLVGAGPGKQDVTNATGSSRDLATLLDQYSKGGYLPNDQDVATGQKFAGQLFQGQRTALNQNFQDQTNNFNQQAALMGRDPNDPVFRNKLMQEQTRQTALLDANQGAFGTQMALDSPMQRLQFKQQQTQVLGGLASQALANRQALAAMGEGIMTGERNFRLQTGTKWGKEESGGGLKGGLTGMLAGAGAGFGMAGGFGGAGAPTTGFSGMPAASMSNVQAGAFSNSLQMPQFGSSFGQQPSPYSFRR